MPGVFVFPEIKITDKVDTHFERFFVEVDGEKVDDSFNDELALGQSRHRSIPPRVATIFR